MSRKLNHLRKRLCFSRIDSRIMILTLIWGISIVTLASLEFNPKISERSQQDTELLRMIDRFLKKRSSTEGDVQQIFKPPIEYEQLRRRIRSNILEMFNCVDFELSNTSKSHASTPDFSDNIDNIIEVTTEQKNSLLNDVDEMQKHDGFEQIRQTEAKKLSDLVQRRLVYLQNPTNCTAAKKLKCTINRNCGFGCEVHDIVYCFIIAYAAEYTFVLKSNPWRYNKDGWEDIFKPVSENCTPTPNLVKYLGLGVPPPPQAPLAIPEDLAPRLNWLHGNPSAWWIGQFFKYLFRFQPKTQALIEAATRKLGFKSPIVGVHIRRTDKIQAEAASHSIEEYMDHVDEYYDRMEMSQHVDKRRVYLATDDPKVHDEVREKYPDYEVIGDSNAAQMAAPGRRYSPESLYGILLDIHFLSLTDYLVCTFSSQICRMAYEMMQTMHPDASHRFKSLDDIYFFPIQNPHNMEAVLPHHPRNGTNEISLEVGDLIGVAGNHWNGYSIGRNKRKMSINNEYLFCHLKNRLSNHHETIDPIEISDLSQKRAQDEKQLV